MDLLVLTGLFILFSSVGLILLIKNNRFVKSSIKTTGEVVEVWNYQSTNNVTMYSSKVEFRTIKNEVVIITNPSSSNRKPKIGKPITIYYKEEEPNKAKIGSVFELYIIPALLLILGLFSFSYLEIRSWWLGRQIHQTLLEPSLDGSTRNW